MHQAAVLHLGEHYPLIFKYILQEWFLTLPLLRSCLITLCPGEPVTPVFPFGPDNPVLPLSPLIP